MTPDQRDDWSLMITLIFLAAPYVLGAVMAAIMKIFKTEDHGGGHEPEDRDVYHR